MLSQSAWRFFLSVCMYIHIQTSLTSIHFSFRVLLLVTSKTSSICLKNKTIFKGFALNFFHTRFKQLSVFAHLLFEYNIDKRNDFSLEGFLNIRYKFNWINKLINLEKYSSLNFKIFYQNSLIVKSGSIVNSKIKIHVRWNDLFRCATKLPCIWTIIKASISVHSKKRLVIAQARTDCRRANKSQTDNMSKLIFSPSSQSPWIYNLYPLSWQCWQVCTIICTLKHGSQSMQEIRADQR